MHIGKLVFGKGEKEEKIVMKKISWSVDVFRLSNKRLIHCFAPRCYCWFFDSNSISLANSHFLPSTFLFKMPFSPCTTRWTPTNWRKNVIIKFLHNALMYLAFNYYDKKPNTLHVCRVGGVLSGKLFFWSFKLFTKIKKIQMTVRTQRVCVSVCCERMAK